MTAALSCVVTFMRVLHSGNAPAHAEGVTSFQVYRASGAAGITASMYVYILYSDSLKRFYTGFSEFHWKRQRQHKQKHRGWTNQAHDWKEQFCTVAATVNEARSLEKKIKARGASRFLKDAGLPD
ncbi:MAG: GIY-YIG nuclease family protein [bacterium]